MIRRPRRRARGRYSAEPALRLLLPARQGGRRSWLLLRRSLVIPAATGGNPQIAARLQTRSWPPAGSANGSGPAGGAPSRWVADNVTCVAAAADLRAHRIA